MGRTDQRNTKDCRTGREFTWRDARKEKPQDAAGEVDLREHWVVLCLLGLLRVSGSLEGECWERVNARRIEESFTCCCPVKDKTMERTESFPSHIHDCFVLCSGVRSGV